MPADERLRDALAAFAKRVHQDLDAQIPRLATEVGRVVTSERRAWRDEHVGAFTRLLAAIRQLDDAVSLSGVLKALASGAMTEATRVALMLVDPDDERVRVWGLFGFRDAPHGEDLSIRKHGPLARAIERKQAVAVTAADSIDPASPAFLALQSGQSGLLVPLIVGGNVVVVLYADGLDRMPDSDDAPVWQEQVEILVRHASLRLENVTSLRTVEVLTSPA